MPETYLTHDNHKPTTSIKSRHINSLVSPLREKVYYSESRISLKNNLNNAKYTKTQNDKYIGIDKNVRNIIKDYDQIL